MFTLVSGSIIIHRMLTFDKGCRNGMLKVYMLNVMALLMVTEESYKRFDSTLFVVERYCQRLGNDPVYLSPCSDSCLVASCAGMLVHMLPRKWHHITAIPLVNIDTSISLHINTPLNRRNTSKCYFVYWKITTTPSISP